LQASQQATFGTSFSSSSSFIASRSKAGEEFKTAAVRRREVFVTLEAIDLNDFWDSALPFI
jgi:hypothetical protein